jgi:biotin transport system substrate-specific component
MTIGESLSDRKIAVRIFWIFSFSLFTALGAQLEIFHRPVPFTLQTFFVLLAGGLLLAKNGTSSMMLYLGLGVCGLPVFAGGSFGIAPLLGPSGGYLLAFPLAAACVGSLVERKKNFLWILFSMITGSLIIFLLGTLQLNVVFLHDWKTSLEAGLFIFSVWDAVKITAAAYIVHWYYKNHI